MSVINVNGSSAIAIGSGNSNGGSKDLGSLMSAAATQLNAAPQGSAARELAQPAAAQTQRVQTYAADAADTPAKQAEKAVAEMEALVKRAEQHPNVETDAHAKLALGAAREALTAAQEWKTEASKTTPDLKALDAAKVKAANKIATAKALETAPNFINRLFDQFANAKVKSNVDGELQSFHEHLEEQIEQLGTGDSSNPQKLARYQKGIMMFTVHTNAQSSMIKSIADLDKGITRDFN